MSISRYSDDELLEEVKHRGFKIELKKEVQITTLADGNKLWSIGTQVIIGGIIFELSN